jgi:hypothetical protein
MLDGDHAVAAGRWMARRAAMPSPRPTLRPRRAGGKSNA